MKSRSVSLYVTTLVITRLVIPATEGIREETEFGFKRRMTNGRGLIAFCIALLVAAVLFPLKATYASEKEWKEVVAKARAEGRVVLGTNHGDPSFRQAITTLFSERFGIRVDMWAGDLAELNAIVDRECAANRPTMDVLLGGNTELFQLYPKGCLAPVKPKLVLPEVTDPKNWRGGFLKWNDPKEEYFFQTAEYVSGFVIVNTKQVKPEQIATAKDLLKSEFQGKIASFDPRRGGSGEATAVYLLVTLGEEYVRQLYLGQKVVSTTNFRQLAEWVGRGVYPIGLASRESETQRFRKEGLPIGVVNLQDAPGFLVGGRSVLKLVQGSPHPNAAVVLLNWLASKEGQELFSRTSLQASRRLDVRLEEIPDYVLPQPGVKYLDTYEYDFYVNRRGELRKFFKQVFGRL